MNATEKPTFRGVIDSLMADRGLDLEELHRRFIATGYGSMSLARFEEHANGETGALDEHFVRGLDRVLDLSDEERAELLGAYVADV